MDHFLLLEVKKSRRRVVWSCRRAWM